MSSNPFKKQSGGALRPLTYILAFVVAFGIGGTIGHLRPKTASAPNGYLVLDLAYVNGKLARPFVVDAGADHDTCVQEGKQIAEELLASPDAPPGVSMAVDCVPMPPTPAAAPHPDAPATLKPHVGEQGDSENSTVI